MKVYSLRTCILVLCLYITSSIVVADTSEMLILNPSSSYLRHKRTVPSILQNLAVDRMLKDRGFVMSVINCVLEKGHCDAHGRHMKRLAPEILRGHCPGCTRTIHTQIRRVISHIQRNFPHEWSEVMSRFLRNPSQHMQSNLFG